MKTLDGTCSFCTQKERPAGVFTIEAVGHGYYNRTFGRLAKTRPLPPHCTPHTLPYGAPSEPTPPCFEGAESKKTTPFVENLTLLDATNR